MSVNTVVRSTEDYEVVVLCLCESGRTLLPRDLVNGMQQAVRLHIVPKRGDFRPPKGTLVPNPTLKSASLTHLRCRIPASLRATATTTHNMLDRLAIRRPHARNTDHFLTRSRELAAASHSASRTATRSKISAEVRSGVASFGSRLAVYRLELPAANLGEISLEEEVEQSSNRCDGREAHQLVPARSD